MVYRIRYGKHVSPKIARSVQPSTQYRRVTDTRTDARTHARTHTHTHTHTHRPIANIANIRAIIFKTEGCPRTVAISSY